MNFGLKSCSGSIGIFLSLCILLFVTSCADYENGYQQGYNNIDARKWLIIGRELYKEGYEQGQMQAFQDDWYAENADDIDVTMSCPALIIRENPILVFTE